MGVQSSFRQSFPCINNLLLMAVKILSLHNLRKNVFKKKDLTLGFLDKNVRQGFGSDKPISSIKTVSHMSAPWHESPCAQTEPRRREVPNALCVPGCHTCGFSPVTFSPDRLWAMACGHFPTIKILLQLMSASIS